MNKEKGSSIKLRKIKPSKSSQKIVGSKAAFIDLLKRAVKTEPFDKKGK